ncbi:MAG TPA: sigma-70 family RNA polymerase sigma factor [Thermoanaerobaculia bacterium]|jgi:RNA polymerase sigma-70 factor (ECF subfamily)|nr:sigma-70 family RNA polymerase sigma factor [Thermoanaerobaculia bacterium]
MASQDALYEEAAGEYSAALERLAGSYEFDRDKCRDLLQDIHLAIWRSFERFAGNCSLRTWVYRVAHNVAASHAIRHRRAGKRPLVSLDDVDDLTVSADSGDAFDQQQSLERLREFIQQLNPLERQVILLYLEGTDAVGIAEITGISAGNVATKIHRIKKILAGRFGRGDRHGK